MLSALINDMQACHSSCLQDRTTSGFGSIGLPKWPVKLVGPLSESDPTHARLRRPNLLDACKRSCESRAPGSRLQRPMPAKACTFAQRVDVQAEESSVAFLDGRGSAAIRQKGAPYGHGPQPCRSITCASARTNPVSARSRPPTNTAAIAAAITQMRSMNRVPAVTWTVPLNPKWQSRHWRLLPDPRQRSS